MRLKGFEAGQAVHEWSTDFALDDVVRSLLESTVADPHPLVLHRDDHAVNDTDHRRQARVSLPPYGESEVGGGQAYYEHPDWYFEGCVLPSGRNSGELPRLRVFTYADELSVDGALIGLTLWQRIPDIPDPGGDITFVPE